MRNRIHYGLKERPASECAFTLIELIAVLAIIAILAALVVPNLLKQLDLATGNKEVLTLQSFANALQSSTMRNRSIPGTNNWVATLATELGMGTNDVATNASGTARLFLVDPYFQVGANAAGVLPYTQTTNGSALQPVSPRLMIVSSIGKALPTTVGTASTDFSNIWTTVDGTAPTNATGFSSWTANDAGNLKVQRINLSPLFAHLLLNTFESTGNGGYLIDTLAASGTNGISVTTNGINAYYIQDSVLYLYTYTNTLDSQQILSADSSFVYYQNVWCSSLPGTPNNPAGILSFAAIVSAFLSAPPNTTAGASSQQQVVNAMTTFMNDYSAWATNSSPTFSHASPYYTPAVNAQAAMITTVNNLYVPPYLPPQGP